MENKKTSIVFGLFLGCQLLFAGTMETKDNLALNTTIPCYSDAWMFGFAAFTAQPSTGNFTYSGFTENTTEGSHLQQLALNPQWAMGFLLETGYTFHKGTDLSIHWYHFNNQDDYPLDNAGTQLGFLNGTAQVASNWNVVHLEMGQVHNLSEYKFIRVHAGAQYLRLTTNRNTQGFFTKETTQVVPEYSFQQAGFNGFGPRVGVNLYYGWANKLGIYGDFALGLFAGSKGFSQLPFDLQQDATYAGSRDAVVPGVDMKVGITYAKSLSVGDIKLDVGWLLFNYFNVHEYREVFTSSLSTINDNDYGLQGPYLGFKWVSNFI